MMPPPHARPPLVSVVNLDEAAKTKEQKKS